MRLALPCRAIITPAALDAAARLGVVLERDTGKNEDADVPSRVEPEAFAALKQRVRDRLSPSLREHPMLDELIRESLAAFAALETLNARPSPVSDGDA